jgi:membrane protein required for colicin V production
LLDAPGAPLLVSPVVIGPTVTFSHGLFTSERGMNTFDIIVIVVLAYSLLRGLFRGLLKEAASIVGVLGGFFAAYAFYAPAAGYLTGVISNAAYRNLIAFLAIFCIVVIVVNVIAVVIKYLMRVVFLGWLDRLGGFLFGAVKGVLIVSVVFLALTAFLPKGTPIIRDSATAPYVAVAAETLSTVVSSDIKNEFTSKLEALKKGWDLFK